MIPLTKAELSFGLVEQPLAKPDSPLESVVKGRFGPDNLSQPKTERWLQGGTETFTLQFRRDLTVFLGDSLTLQARSAYAIPKKRAIPARISIVAPVKHDGMRSLDSAEGLPYSPVLPLTGQSATPLEAALKLLLGQCGRILALATLAIALKF